ncbi:hypothetical protein CY35_02G055900 [Sphagnum magellanicum]|nr:hypothetical protein CY35_02G055900 [Sphagnum magellanicum]KAH9570711.1 hypothetical protein CY35_02G055900 [Sphagnum magellanicum]
MELLRADAFERLVPGRRLVFTYPVVVACEKAGNNSRRRVSVVVMDSVVDRRDSRVECAAMVVPCHKERDWIYASEGGQWQLLASAAASRLIMIFRNGVLLGEGGEVREEEEAPSERPRKKKKKKGLSRERKKMNGMSGNREQEQRCRHENQKFMKEDGNGCENSRRRARIGDGDDDEDFVQFCDCENCDNDDDDDEGLKKQLGPLVVALAPRICFQAGPPVIPFVSYADNILQRIVVEEAYSTLTGAIVVEDVALLDENATISNSGSSSGRTDDSKDSDVQFLPCVVDEGLRRKAPQWKQLCDEEDRYSKSVRVVWRRRLRFKRMPNLIQTEVSLNFQSGTQTSASEAQRLVLVAPALEAWMELGKRVKVLALGIGGGALPIFLHKHFGFHVQCVALVSKEGVVILACMMHDGRLWSWMKSYWTLLADTLASLKMR